MEELTGYVDHIIYQNRENAYTVLEFHTAEGACTAVGTFPGIRGAENLILRGEYRMHRIYGRQFQVSSYDFHMPDNIEAMHTYLASGAVRGIGTTLAGRIIERFGEDTFRIMEEEPERLAEIKGISQRGAMDISDQMRKKHASRDAMIFLDKYGIHSGTAVKVYEKYGDEIYHIIRENPYRLAAEVDGIGFKIADDIARRSGVAADSEFRIESGVEYVLGEAAGGEGHTYLPRPQLVDRTARMLEVPYEDVDDQLMNLAVDGRIVIRTRETEDGMEYQEVFLRRYYRMEEMAAGMVLELNVPHKADPKRFQDIAERMRGDEGMELDEQQLQAVALAAENGVFILTGGPGTGKTTTIRAMLAYFADGTNRIRLAAPTGRAAKRMSEATGYHASTIHRLLGAKISSEDSGKTGFELNEENPLKADVVIIDEVSMVDISLFNALLRALQDKTRLILVGDADQLPSVGPGNVLHDLIESGLFPTVELTRIFRQDEESDIVLNAHRIRNGEPVPLDNKGGEFFFLHRNDAKSITGVILSLVRDKLPHYVDASTNDIQVLSPSHSGLVGVDSLNETLQKCLNPPSGSKHEYSTPTRVFREGDKVMQVRNDYQLEWRIPGVSGISTETGMGVFNGDTGIVEEINTFAGTLTVRFDEGRRASYKLKQLDELELAYAVTIHKSQGSEYPAVVIPLFGVPHLLIRRNLIYTAVTRAEKCVVLVGDERVFRQMCSNDHVDRYSGFLDRLLELGI